MNALKVWLHCLFRFHQLAVTQIYREDYGPDRFYFCGTCHYSSEQKASKWS